jgi:hypothetical protein
MGNAQLYQLVYNQPKHKRKRVSYFRRLIIFAQWTQYQCVAHTRVYLLYSDPDTVKVNLFRRIHQTAFLPFCPFLVLNRQFTLPNQILAVEKLKVQIIYCRTTTYRIIPNPNLHKSHTLCPGIL